MEQQLKVFVGFEKAFSQTPEFIVKAPGRVNLIGEHTDYNDGFVFPCAIDYATLVAVSAREDQQINVIALDYQEDKDSFLLGEPIDYLEHKQWANYVRGVIAEFQQRGYALRGCDLAITGNVPQGAGLSSSAALEVGIAYALDQLCQLNLSKQEIALISQAAENNFVGCACGIMDQLISACGQAGAALGIDCRTLELIPAQIPQGYTVMMINSNVQRGLVESEYNLRRQQCEQAAAHFEQPFLRDVSIAMFEQHKAGLEPIAAKRAEHVVYENQRTLSAITAFNQADIGKISELMAQSHRSMRDLFEITTPEIDFLVELVDGVVENQGGARMTGGGFGGCIVALVPDPLVEAVQQEINTHYQPNTGLHASIYTSQPMQGVALMPCY